MYINFWYPVMLAEALEDAPQRVRMLGQDFVAFRDTGGKAHVLANTCSHRGGALAGGKMKGDRIECPYHGWQFDGQGICHRIPSIGADASIPSRARVDAYPVREQYGIVFAFLGDLPEGERPPFMEIPEFEADGWRTTWMNYQVPFNYERSIENGMDPAHNEFVHPTHGHSGENQAYQINDLRWVGDGVWGPGWFHKFNSPASGDSDFSTMKKANDQREAGSGVIGPNHMWTYIRFSPGNTMHQYMYECPIDAGNTNIFLVNLRTTLLDPELDDKVSRMNWMVAQQDVTVLSALNPLLTPPTNTKEFMMPADEPILRYREKLREWDGFGWRIDVDAVEAQAGKVAWAVPCPARRDAKGWVLDEIPRLPGGGGAAAGSSQPGAAGR